MRAVESAAGTTGRDPPADPGAAEAPFVWQGRRYRRAPIRVHFPAFDPRPAEARPPVTKRHIKLNVALLGALELEMADRVMLGCQQFVYWDPTDPGKNVQPDLFVRLGAPDESFRIWKVWERGAPHVAVEIISTYDSREMVWEDKLSRYRQMGVQELVRFDGLGGTELTVWDRIDDDLAERELEAKRAAFSGPLGLWWVVVDDEEGPALRLARDAEGRELLPTPAEACAQARRRSAEAERRSAEAERRSAEAERRSAEAERERRELEERVQALEAELARRGGP